ncbi:hypothetical protein HK097_007456 [Rhizophlyctis rosea]|uniref:Alpha/beta hydrolase fold-3 domain-containing protein n=1 Tax=Rhizophlyctis rosea TaxID=64517 RepID=A0AAD5SBQ5_9FUNG|nr:hypothetical protein HK097_007456 [Rhizophlyctis rosea]
MAGTTEPAETTPLVPQEEILPPPAPALSLFARLRSFFSNWSLYLRTFLRHYTIGPPHRQWPFQLHLTLNTIRSYMPRTKPAVPPTISQLITQVQGQRANEPNMALKIEDMDPRVQVTEWEVTREDYARMGIWKGPRELDGLLNWEGKLKGEWHTLKNVFGERVHPIERVKNGPVVLYIHGGAYWTLSPATHRNLTQRIAIDCNASVLSIAYRLAPEHPFPHGLQDSLIAYTYLTKTLQISPSRIIFMGDSAGAGLAMSTMVYLAQHGQSVGLQMPAGAALWSPWLDITCTSGPSCYAYNGDYLIPGCLDDPARAYAGVVDQKYPLLSTLYADLKGLPPILAQTGSIDLLHSDSVVLHEKLAKLAQPHTVQVYSAMPHTWVGWEYLPEAQRAWKELKIWVEALFAGQVKNEGLVVIGE